MEDTTTIDHGRAAYWGTGSESKKGDEGEADDRSIPSVNAVLDTRPTERYVPKAVRCDRCGCAGESFTWFQQVSAGDVDGERPARDRYFCGIVCLALYCSERYEDYSPSTKPTAVEYD